MSLERVAIAIGETVILLHHPLPLVGVSIAMERERQQNGSLANGIGGNEWRSADDWPIPARPTKYYLAEAGQVFPPSSRNPKST